MSLARLKTSWSLLKACTAAVPLFTREFAAVGHSSNDVLENWKGLLRNEGIRPASVETELQGLLKEAARFRSNRMYSGVPEEAIVVLMRVYSEYLTRDEKLRFFELLCRDFGVEEENIATSIKHWKKASDLKTGAEDERVDKLLRATTELSKACKPLYSSLFIPISQIPEGIKFLVDMRADLVDLIKAGAHNAPHLRALSEDLRVVLSEWFSVGLLQLKRISWTESSAALLERLIKYEAVHPMSSLDEVKTRIGRNRRVYAYFHPSMPDEPLVVLYTALTDFVPSNVPSILDRAPTVSEDDATVAVFFSISATQQGLTGVSLGNFIIKNVAQRVQAEFPNVQTLVTLSPIPGLRKWLDARLKRELDRVSHIGDDARDGVAAADALLLPSEVAHLTDVNMPPHGSMPVQEYSQALYRFHDILTTASWLHDRTAEELIKPIMVRLAAHYVVREKRRFFAMDTVANFHLNNGARVRRFNWKANMSTNFVKQSYGLMVNYEYILSDVHENNRKYLIEHEVVVSPAVLEVLSEELSLT